MVARFYGILERVPRLLMSCQMLLFSVVFANTMRVCRDIVQLGRSLMIFVMRSVVIPCRHNLFQALNLLRLGMRFLRQLISVV